MMKIHYHPVSTTSRPLMLFAQENAMDVKFKVVDLMTGEHHKPPFTAMNPNRLVPVLQDDDFTLTESSAILKYLAEKIDSPLYPKALRERARVNEVMDWVATQLSRDFAYGLIYPQIFPGHKRPTDDLQKGTLAWAKERVQQHLKVLDEHIIGDKPYVAGDKLTIADYYAAAFVALGEAIRCDFGKYPNLARWLGKMKTEIKCWNKVHEVFYGFAGSMKDRPFEAL